MPIDGLIKLRDYFVFTFRERPRAYLNEPVSFCYGTNIYRINADTPVKAIVKFVELVNKYENEIQGDGDIHDKIFLPEDTDGGHALRLQHDLDHEYFYCYYLYPRMVA